MNDNTRTRVLYAVLAVAVLFGLYNFTIGRKSAPLPTTPPLAASVSAPDTLHKAPIAIVIEEFAAQPWGRDPFERSGITAPNNLAATAPGVHQPLTKAAVWILTGIVYSSSSPLAFINQKAVKVGDMVDQARVVRIDKDKVLLEHNGTRFDIFITKG